MAHITSADESQGTSAGVVWAHWVSTGLSILCLFIGAGELQLRHPLLVVLWLLGNTVLAAVRLSSHATVGFEDRLLLKVLLWVVGLLSIPLLVWACFTNDDIIAQDADTTTRQHQTSSWGGPKEEELVITHYRTTCLLFEERVGGEERRLVRESR